MNHASSSTILMMFFLGGFATEAVHSQQQDESASISSLDLLDDELLSGLDLSDQQKELMGAASKKIASDFRNAREAYKQKFIVGKKTRQNSEAIDLTPAEELARSIELERQRDELRQIGDAKRIATQNALNEILLPHQKKKMLRLQLWTIYERQYGTRSVLNNKFVQSKLEMTSEQRKAVEPEATKIQAEFNEELKKLKQKYRKLLIAKVLSKEQQAKYDRVIGKDIGMGPRYGIGF